MKTFDDLFYQFDVEGRIVLFPKDIFTDVEALKAGEIEFDLKQTAKGAWLAILPVEAITITNFRPKIYKRED